MVNVSPYLIFEGNCRKAMEFYKGCLGGVLYVSTYGDLPADSGSPGVPAEYKDWVLHARLTIKNIVLMASDTRPGMPVKHGDNIMVCIGCEHAGESEKIYNALSVKGQIELPLQKTFFSPSFGMFTDQFGVKWMINVEDLTKARP